MADLPPKGKVSLSDLRKLYNLMSKDFYNSQTENVVCRVWEDMVFSLKNIQDWYQDSYDDEKQDLKGSIEEHLENLYEAKDIDEIFVAIDNCLNDYHGMGIFLEYIISSDFEKSNNFLDEMRDE
jgi:hypothetical protein